MKPLPSCLQLIKQPLKERRPLTNNSNNNNNTSLEPSSPAPQLSICQPHRHLLMHRERERETEIEVALEVIRVLTMFSLYSSSANGFIYAVNRYCRVCNKLQQIYETITDYSRPCNASQRNETLFVSALIVSLNVALNSSVSAMKLQVEGYKVKLRIERKTGKEEERGIQRWKLKERGISRCKQRYNIKRQKVIMKNKLISSFYILSLEEIRLK